MAKKAREDEIEAPPPPPVAKRSRTRGATSTAAPGMCDDVLRGIFARVPARTAIASMALSKHRRRLIRCPDFVTLHSRLAPPLPHPHIAYVATAKLRRSGGGGKRDPVPVSGYHGFHVAGGAGLGSSNARMRSLAGPMHLERRYVNTCKGVVLLAGGKATPTTTTCVLWNPAVADEEREVSVPIAALDDCEILGLGYGPRRKTYKLLLTRREEMDDVLECDPPMHRLPKELLVYALGGGGAGEQPIGGGGAREQPLLRSLLSEGLDGDISGKSLYIDGTIYLLHYDNSVILAVDVDNETVATIDLPGDRDGQRPAMSGLLVLSGRPCVDVWDRSGGRALWLLTVDHQWERRCIVYDGPNYNLHRYTYSMAGVWDCGGMLAIYMSSGDHADSKLFLYCTATKKQKMLKLPWSLSPKWPDYAFCWGYKPTLVSPWSIVGELSQNEERRRERTADIMAALKPAIERDGRKGQEATLDTVCFMEFLLRIMRKLPENMQDVIEMPLLKSEDSYSSFNSEPSHSDDSDTCSAEDEMYHLDSSS